MKKVAFHTLGCKVNQVETENIKESFIKNGYSIVNFDELADVYIINTCTVTHISDRKSRAMIRRAIRKNPNSIVAAIGCTAQVNAEELSKIEGINCIIGNQTKENIVDIIESQYHSGKIIIDNTFSKDEKLKKVIYDDVHDKTRAFVKIQDGCESFCSYCIVPYARGPIRSKAADDIIEEVKHLVALGYKEIVLSGIHTGFYGFDLQGWNLTNLLEAIVNRIDGEYRLRLSSIEPLEVNEKLIDIIKDNNLICNHLHIPLQSGSNNILKQMNRRYSREEYINLLTQIHSKIPDIAITTDIMVGFPGETEEDFALSYDLIENLPIYDLHVFKYSKRPGTLAHDFDNQISSVQKQARSSLLVELAEQKRIEYITKFIGKELRVLVESRLNEKILKGLTDNYIETIVNSEQDLEKSFVNVVLTGMNEKFTIGKLSL